MPGVPFGGGPDLSVRGGFKTSAGLPDGKVGLRELPHAEGQVAERASDLHRSSDPDCEGGREISELMRRAQECTREFDFKESGGVRITKLEPRSGGIL